MKKRGAISESVFVYILLIITVSIILIYGYTVIHQMSIREKQVSETMFITKLRADINSIAAQPGTEELITYSLSADYDYICFADFDKDIWEPDQDVAPPIEIFDMIDAESQGQNVFLVKGITPQAVTIEQVATGPNIKCFQIQNSQLQITLKGEQGKALVS